MPHPPNPFAGKTKKELNLPVTPHKVMAKNTFRDGVKMTRNKDNATDNNNIVSPHTSNVL